MNEENWKIPVTSLMPSGERDVAEFDFSSLYPQAEDMMRKLLDSEDDFRVEGRCAVISNEVVEFSLIAVGSEMKIVVTARFDEELSELVSRISENVLSDAEIEEAVELLSSEWCFSTECSARRTVSRAAKYEEVITVLCELAEEVAAVLNDSVSQIESTIIRFASQEEKYA